jgi:L-ascorbate metabolism protein UlaG (beta-lactamase superfamily)
MRLFDCFSRCASIKMRRIEYNTIKRGGRKIQPKGYTLVEGLCLWYNTIRARTEVPARTYVRETKSFMEISWFGHACFQLRGKNVNVVTDPFSPQQPSSSEDTARLLSKINASIVTISHAHPGHNYVEAVGGKPRVVRGPGEYEISDVLITGIASYHDNKRGQEHGRNTIYVIHMDDLVICHLGDLGHTLHEEQLEEVADADVLLLPIGGQHTINAAQAAEIISQVEPRIAIPMHYHSASEEGLDPLNKFCREMGIEAISPQAKLSVTRANLPAEMQIVVLTAK